MLILAHWLAMSAIILTGTATFHQPNVQLLTHPGFAQYSYLLIWMVLGFLRERTAQVLGLKGAFMLKMRIYVFPSLMIMVLVPMLKFTMFRALGFDGLIIGLILATSVSFISIMFVNKIQFQRVL